MAKTDDMEAVLQELAEEALMTGGGVWTVGSGRRVSRRPPPHRGALPPPGRGYRRIEQRRRRRSGSSRSGA